MKEDKYFGLDIGGTGIKGAIVDLNTGEFLTERYRLDTPHPATPKTVVQTAQKVIAGLNWKKGPVGCGFPAIVKKGVCYTASNIHKSWIGENVEKLLKKKTGLPCFVLNDADAAGLASMKFGSGKGNSGMVIFVTIGTGIGSAIFYDGRLVPNSELGHIYLDNQVAEKIASKAAQKRSGISGEEWGGILNRYFKHLERILAPDLFIIGGGGAKNFSDVGDYLKLNTEAIPAVLKNNAGIVGAALYAKEKSKS